MQVHSQVINGLDGPNVIEWLRKSIRLPFVRRSKYEELADEHAEMALTVTYLTIRLQEIKNDTARVIAEGVEECKALKARIQELEAFIDARKNEQEQIHRLRPCSSS